MNLSTYVCMYVCIHKNTRPSTGAAPGERQGIERDQSLGPEDMWILKVRAEVSFSVGAPGILVGFVRTFQDQINALRITNTYGQTKQDKTQHNKRR